MFTRPPDRRYMAPEAEPKRMLVAAHSIGIVLYFVVLPKLGCELAGHDAPPVVEQLG